MDPLQHVVHGELIEKRYRHGTNRTCSPHETRARLAPFLSAMGITRVANVTGLDHVGIPIVIVYRPNARSLSSAQGKGLDLDDVRASGLMEAVESFHAEHIDRPTRFESYAELSRKFPVVELQGLPRAAGSHFDPDKRIPWIEGYDLLNDKPAWAPFELVHTDFRIPPPEGSGFFLQTSNGLAAGNHFLEALIHAVSEVIEADALALWSFVGRNARRKRRILLETVDDPACQKTIKMYKEAGILVAAWNLTTDIGVPTFECQIVSKIDEPSRRLYATCGSGSHPSRNIALLRALLEAEQCRLTLIAGSRDDFSRKDYATHRSRRVVDWFRSEIRRASDGTDFRGVPSFDGRTLNEDLQWLLDRLRSVGMRQVVAVNLSKPELGIPVVRVIVPQLEGLSFASKYAPGRRARMRSAGKR
ncbi:MAG: YcaO-like family protein [Candidatus Acidiferrales bacterium]